MVASIISTDAEALPCRWRFVGRSHCCWFSLLPFFNSANPEPCQPPEGGAVLQSCNGTRGHKSTALYPYSGLPRLLKCKLDSEAYSPPLGALPRASYVSVPLHPT